MHTPAFIDLWILVDPPYRERVQRNQRRFFGRGLINQLQPACDGLVIFPRDVFQAVAHHIDNTQLWLWIGGETLFAKNR